MRRMTPFTTYKQSESLTLQWNGFENKANRQLLRRSSKSDIQRRSSKKTIKRSKKNDGDTNVHPLDGGNEISGYNERNHFQVMCRLSGSVWPKVLPYCLLNTVFSALMFYLYNVRGVHYNFSNDANGYMASLLSFLVVSRVRMIYNQVMFSRDRLMKLCRSCEELVQNAALFTSHNGSIDAGEWRESLAYMTILLLKQTMCALRRHNQLLKVQSRELTKNGLLQEEDDENFRKPVKMAYRMRKHIMKLRLCDKLRGRMLNVTKLSEEFKLTASIDQYTAAFHELEGLSRTSFPFPIVQMARTILFIWLMFLPIGLVHDSEYPLWGIFILTFLLTFGFVGLESVSIEMSDPFGTDVSDFDLFFMAEVTFEHIYVAIFNVDGSEAAEVLINKVRNPHLEV